MRTTLLFLLTLLMSSCGGSGSNEVGGAQGLPFTFVWTGEVDAIRDGLGTDATMPNLAIGDTFTARMHYDPADFMPGVAITFGRRYAANVLVTIVFEFSSGLVAERAITDIDARDTDNFCQWNLRVGSSLMFQANDWTDTSFGVLTPDFLDTHEQFTLTQGAFAASTGNRLEFDAADPLDARNVNFTPQSFFVQGNAVYVP